MTESGSNIELEIEAAYLAKRLPEGMSGAVPVRVLDIYISDDTDLLTKLRLRQKGDTYELTKKVNLDPADLSLQNEYTIPLTKEEFTKLRIAGKREVEKDRYMMAAGKHMAEIDVFQGALAGLVMIEFEFGSTDERNAFQPPAYCGSEVTQEDFVAGAYLAGKSYKDIASELEQLGYRAFQ
jgi:adenylate cyclase